MTEPILHHFDLSPFSEKLRLVLGFKGLSWCSVAVPMVLPKPDVVALTGGYRRTPFLQIGADIYCDTALVCRVLDRLVPEPPLYPAHQRGLAEILGQWADTALFWVAVPFTSQPASMPHLFPGASAEFIRTLFEDRAAMAPQQRRLPVPDGEAHLHVYLRRLAQLLEDGRPYLLGDAACIADFSAVHPLWYMHRSPPVAGRLAAYPALSAWYRRVVAVGHGHSRPLGSGEAIAVAAAASGHAPSRVLEGSGFAAGQAVQVTPADYAQVPVAGRLVGLEGDEVVLERDDPRAGRVHVHFPRVGYRLEAAG